ncbi:23032_t:CDS:2, partial [Cetraspora pellucida]
HSMKFPEEVVLWLLKSPNSRDIPTLIGLSRKHNSANVNKLGFAGKADH